MAWIAGLGKWSTLSAIDGRYTRMYCEDYKADDGYEAE
jgi:hypothetical protein